MPSFRSFRPDGATYVLQADRLLPDDQRVTIHHRDPNPLETAEFEQNAGRFVMGEGGSTVTVDGDGTRKADLAGGTYWVGHGPTNAIRALLQFVTDVTGALPDGVVYPRDGSQDDKLAFWAQWEQADLYEIAEAILERKGLTEVERGN